MSKITEAHAATGDGCDTVCGIDLVIVPDEFPEGVAIADEPRQISCPECKGLPMTHEPMAAETPVHEQMRVTSVRYETPKTIARTVAKQDATHWWVQCEGDGCTNVITMGKRHWIPTDFKRDDSPTTEVRLTAPSARRCAHCGPFPRNAK